jgi:ribonuclease J
VFVDGASVGDVGPAVLRERDTLSQNGFVVVAVQLAPQTRQLVGEPQIVSRGFVYARESEELMDGAKEVVATAVRVGARDASAIADKVAHALEQYLYRETGRHPVVIPIVMGE